MSSSGLSRKDILEGRCSLPMRAFPLALALLTLPLAGATTGYTYYYGIEGGLYDPRYDPPLENHHCDDPYWGGWHSPNANDGSLMLGAPCAAHYWRRGEYAQNVPGASGVATLHIALRGFDSCGSLYAWGAYDLKFEGFCATTEPLTLTGTATTTGDSWFRLTYWDAENTLHCPAPGAAGDCWWDSTPIIIDSILVAEVSEGAYLRE